MMAWCGRGKGVAKRKHGPAESHPSRFLDAQLPRGCQTPAPAALPRRQFDTSCGRASAVPTTWSGQRKDEACILFLPMLLASSLEDACSPGNWTRPLVDCACPASKPITSPLPKQFSVCLVRPASLAPSVQCQGLYYCLCRLDDLITDTDYLTHLGLEHTSRSTVHTLQA